MDAALTETLVCSRCRGGALRAVDGGGARCTACGCDYPMLEGIPCLVPDPPLFRLEWRGRLGEYVAAVDARLRQINVERDADDLSRRARERMLRLAGALHNQRRAVETLLAPVVSGITQPGLSLPTAAPGSEAPLAVVEHYENIFRDWAWGTDENTRVRQLVKGMAPPERLRRVAIHGSGAGRLAVDVHTDLAPEQTFALDLNPLPLIVAERLLRGETVVLPEFPVAPRGEKDVVVVHELATAAPPAGLTFMFADALQPPFAAGSLDAVVTPWFIDAVGVDLAITAAAINRVLRPGGWWLNVGPLAFKDALAGQHTIEEVLEIVGDGGFEMAANGSEDVPYFRSPHTGSSRVETLFWYAARKTAETAGADGSSFAGGAELASSGPPWLADAALPVPALPQFGAVHRSSVFTIGLLSMVDGKRSIAEMAAQLAQSWNAEPTAVQTHIRAFFASLVK